MVVEFPIVRTKSSSMDIECKPTFPTRSMTMGDRVGSKFAFPTCLQDFACLLMSGGGWYLIAMGSKWDCV